MPKGYVIARAEVTDAAKWAEYVAAAKTAIDKYGGKPIARGGRWEVVEGEARPRNVIIEFESFEQARAYAFSEEYAAARRLREGAGIIDLVVVEGV